MIELTFIIRCITTNDLSSSFNQPRGYMFLKTNETVARGYMLLKTNEEMGEAELAARSASQK